MAIPKEVCETKKYVSRLKEIMKGKGLLFGRDIDKIDYDGLEFLNDISLNLNKDSYDYILANCFDINLTISIVENLLSLVKPNGFVVLYIPHNFYYPFSQSMIPHDILIKLRHIYKYMFEIIDFQSFGYDGSYGSQDLEKVEYAFQIVLKKANSLFNKRDLSDDPGQLVSLDE